MYWNKNCRMSGGVIKYPGDKPESTPQLPCGGHFVTAPEPNLLEFKYYCLFRHILAGWNYEEMQKWHELGTHNIIPKDYL